MKFFLSLVGLLVLGVGLSGCSTASEDALTTLVYGRGGEADSLDPIHTDVGETVKVLDNLYDTLVTYDEQSLEIVPSLATRWEVSPDGQTWTFHLRERVKFHDGTDFDAAAVKFSFDRLRDPEHPHVHSDIVPFRPTFAVIESITTPDARTVVFRLKRRDAIFLENLCTYAAMIVSPTAVKKEGVNFATRPIGTGPFRLAAWVRDEQLVLEAFADHWRGKPRVERVVFVPVSESAVRVKQLQRGEIHIADTLPPADIAALAKSPGVTILAEPGVNVGYLSMNTQKPPLNNPKLRQAIWHAIDKPKLIADYFNGRAAPAVNLTPPTIWGHHDELEDRAFDLEKARALVAEAQAETPFELPLKLDLFVMDRPRPYMQLPRETAVYIKDQLEPLGIEVRVVQSEINEHFRRMSLGEHDLGLAGWSSDNSDPDNFLYVLLHSDNIRVGGTNNSRYQNAEVDRLLMAAKEELDRSKRAAIYREVQSLVYADAPSVPLVHTEVQIAQRDNVRGFYLHPASMTRLRTVYFEAPPQ